MYKVFIDTCSFEKLGLNFAEENGNRIKSLIEYSNNDIKIILISVIKNEIINHIESNIKNEIDDIKTLSKKIKWMQNYLTDEIIESNAQKKLNDFNDFLKKANVQEEDINDILPEVIFEKYFKIKLPFEETKNKRKEFPDAFFVEKIRKIINLKKSEKFILVSSDNGVKESLIEEKNLIIKDDINQLLTLLSNVCENVRKDIELSLERDNYDKVLDSILLDANILYDEDEYTDFDIDYLQIESMYSINIVNFNDETNEYIVSSDFSFKVCGNFIKRNLSNCIYDRESNEYVYEEYDNICGIYIPSVYVEMIIKKEDSNYIFNGINYCNDLKIYDAFSFEYIEKNISPNRLDNMIAV